MVKKWIYILVAVMVMAGCGVKTGEKQEARGERSEALEKALEEAEEMVKAKGERRKARGEGREARGGIRRIAVTSATQVGMLHALGETERIVAVANKNLYYNLSDSLRDAVADLGNDYELNIEKTILTHPDVLLMTDYGFRTQGIDEVERAGIRVLYLSEWREQDPIRRAEWLRVIGQLTGREEMADSLLAVVKTEYERLSALTRDIEHRRTLAAGQSYRGTWYVPTAGTYMGKIIADAGAEYVFLCDSSTESRPLTIEEALMQMSDAEVWMGAQAETLEELAKTDARHTWMRAYKEGNVYAWDKTRNETGGNDFWETGVVRPDWILADVIGVLYPEVMEKRYEARFVRKM